MRRPLALVLALALGLPLGASVAPAAEDKLVVYTAYEENELKTFWEQFKKDLPDLAAKAQYIRASTGPIMARVEAEKANPQADVIWGVFNDYLTGAALKGLLAPYVAKESQAIPARFKHPESMWQGVTLLAVGFAVNRKKMEELKLRASAVGRRADGRAPLRSGGHGARGGRPAGGRRLLDLLRHP